MSAGVKELKTLAWLGPLYFTEGLPNAIVGSLSVGYYKSMGMDNATVAALTSSLYLPWGGRKYGSSGWPVISW